MRREPLSIGFVIHADGHSMAYQSEPFLDQPSQIGVEGRRRKLPAPRFGPPAEIVEEDLVLSSPLRKAENMP